MIATADVQQRIVEQKVPYLVKGDQWVGYEDVESVTEKVGVVGDVYGGVVVTCHNAYCLNYCCHRKDRCRSRRKPPSKTLLFFVAAWLVWAS